MTDTRWKPGQSGNPKGRPKVVGEVRDLARAHTTAAINTLVSIATNRRAPAAARVSAASALLDRGYGRPEQALHHGGGAEFALTISAPAADFSRGTGAPAPIEESTAEPAADAPPVARLPFIPIAPASTLAEPVQLGGDE